MADYKRIHEIFAMTEKIKEQKRHEAGAKVDQQTDLIAAVAQAQTRAYEDVLAKGTVPVRELMNLGFFNSSLRSGQQKAEAVRASLQQKETQAQNEHNNAKGRTQLAQKMLIEADIAQAQKEQKRADAETAEVTRPRLGMRLEID